MSVASPIDYLSIFRTRRDYSAALLELSRGQEELIESDDYTQLLVLLGRKQAVLGRMEELSRARPALWQCWRNDRDDLDPVTREQCEAVLADTETILAELNQQEHRCTERLQTRREQTRRELETLAHGVRIRDAYRDPGSERTHQHLDVGQ